MNVKSTYYALSIILVLSLLFPAGSVEASRPGVVNSASTLLVDPLKNNGSLIWNTFLGGNDPDYPDDDGTDVAVDASGNVYILGTSYATWGAPVKAFAGDSDAFVAKLNNRGLLQWSTFLGGASGDVGYGISVDAGGNVFVAGWSFDTWGEDPILPFTGMTDVFVAKLDPNGVLLWNTFLGAEDEDVGYDIGVDGSGNVYITGYSYTSWGTTIVIPYSEGYDAFVAKLNGNGDLLWNSFLGGTGWDFGYGIAVDSSGIVSVTGTSDVEWGTPQNPFTGWDDAFVVRLDNTGNAVWNTFLGGNGTDSGNGIAIDSGGNISITGTSDEAWGTEPRRAFSEQSDAFVARLDTNGIFTWYTFLGGTGWDEGWGVVVDPKGVVYVTGTSDVTWGSPLRAFSGYQDIQIARLDSSGNLEWNTFLGGAEADNGYVLAADGRRGIVIAGTSWAAWGTPVNAFAGGGEAFAARLSYLGKFLSTASQDGWVLESTETSNLGGTMNAGDITFNLGDDAKDRQFRGILSFNTAPLPDDAVITRATLKIKKAALVGNNPFATHGNILVDIKKGPFGSNAGLQTADFQAAPSKPGVGTIKNALVKGWNQAILINGAFPLINKINITQIRLRFSKDDNDDLGADFLKYYSGNAGAVNRPVLELEYYIP